MSPDARQELRAKVSAALGAGYRLGEELGGGGMSVVFRAEDVELGRQVVVKVLPPEMAAGVNRERFLREIQVVAGLQHPHVVPVHAAGWSGEIAWYTMPFVEGESLRARLQREGSIPAGETVRILRDVLDALAYAHERGVVHRDIKPDNVMCSGPHALVTDFGVAKALARTNASATITGLGITLGTPTYMSPEQAAGDPEIDHRADLYSVGVMAYEMLVGQPPFTAVTPQSLMAMHVTRAPDPLITRAPTVPTALGAMVMRLLEKAPADRFQQAKELLAALDSVRGAQGVSEASLVARRRTDPLRVALLFVLATVGVLSTTRWIVRAFGLPDWVFVAAVGLMVIGAPIVLLASRAERRRLERKRATAPVTLRTVSRPLPVPLRVLSTVRGAMLGGVLAFVSLGVIATSFMVLRAQGIGPFATLFTSSALDAGSAILMADVNNQTADPLLGTAVTEALRIDLTRSRVIRLVEGGEIRQRLRMMELDPGTPLDAALARDVAEREGASAVVAGTISALGSGFGLSVEVLAVRDGSSLLAVRETAASADGIIAAVDRLSRKLREGIGESLRSIRAEERLFDVTTRSLEALRAYSRGIELLALGQNAESQRFLEDAVRIDSTFAMAWRSLSVVYNNTQQPRTRAIGASNRSYALRGRLPEHERLLTEANYHLRVARDPVQAVATFQQILAGWPDDLSALNSMGTMLRAQGLHEEAAATYRAALAIRPVTPVIGNLILTLSDLGAFASADSVLAEGLRLFPTSPNRWQWKGAIRLARDDFTGALAITDSGARERDPRARRIAFTQRTAALEATGRMALARETSLQRAALEVADDAPGTALQVLVQSAVTQAILLGPTPALGTFVDSLLRAHPLASMEAEDRPYQALGEFYFVTGRIAEGRQVIAAMQAALPEQQDEAGPRWLQGLAELAGGRPAAALPLLRQSRERHFSCTACGLWEIARALDAMGQRDSAIVAYEAVVGMPSRFDNAMRYRTLGPAHERLAALHAAAGNGERARAHGMALVELWRDADAALRPRVAAVADGRMR